MFFDDCPVKSQNRKRFCGAHISLRSIRNRIGKEFRTEGIKDIYQKEHELHPPDERKLIEWMAALSAAGIPYLPARRGAAWVLRIPGDHWQGAEREIQICDEINAGWPPAAERPSSARSHDTWSAAWVALFLAWFYVWLGPYDAGSAATAAGGADAARIAGGELWRAITALTLHAGLVHLAGNAAALLVIGHAVCRILGGGLGWLLILASGAVGNVATAFLSRPQHVSVGASTACFGALGILSVYQTMRRLRASGDWRSIWSRTWLPACAGLALLGMTGTGEGSDLLAHGLGFAVGAVLAVPFGLHGARGLPEWAQRVLELICISAVMLCWRAAFRSVL